MHIIGVLTGVVAEGRLGADFGVGPVAVTRRSRPARAVQGAASRAIAAEAGCAQLGVLGVLGGLMTNAPSEERLNGRAESVVETTHRRAVSGRSDRALRPP
jgi:hypothetical protein